MSEIRWIWPTASGTCWFAERGSGEPVYMLAKYNKRVKRILKKISKK
jgi:hypothetical protein